MDLEKFLYRENEKTLDNEEFFLGCHMNAAGYILTAQMVTSYIDYIVRHNFEDFAQVGFIGTPHKYI